jgi:diketogulonate reductase-like aldo/keto reductase
MKEVRLNNGVMMPSVGFGVYQIAKSETKQAVLQALEVGYRMIDTAATSTSAKWARRSAKAVCRVNPFS